MDKDELLGFYSELLQQGNPFQHMGAKPIETVEQGPVKRLARAGIKGATFGMTNQDFQPEGVGEHVAEFLGSVPTTVAATAGVGAIPGVGARLATLGPNLSRIAGAGLVGGAIGAGKAIVNQDPMALVTDPLWWMGTEAGVVGFGALFRQLRSSGMSAAEATKVAEEQILKARPVRQQADQLGRGFIDAEEVSKVGEPVYPTSPFREPAKLRGRTVDAEEVISNRGNVLEPTATPQPESSFFRSPEAYSSPQEMDDVTKLIQDASKYQELDQMLEPTPTQQIHTPLTEPIAFEKETGPKPRFVKDGGRYRTPDEFGTELDSEFYGTPRRMDEFGIEDADNLPDINTFSHGRFDDPRDAGKKLLTVEVDPKTGIKTYTPRDEQTNAAIDAVGMSPRELEPPLDRFQIKAVEKPSNVEKLDLITENENK